MYSCLSQYSSHYLANDGTSFVLHVYGTHKQIWCWSPGSMYYRGENILKFQVWSSCDDIQTETPMTIQPFETRPYVFSTQYCLLSEKYLCIQLNLHLLNLRCSFIWIQIPNPVGFGPLQFWCMFASCSIYLSVKNLFCSSSCTACDYISLVICD